MSDPAHSTQDQKAVFQLLGDPATHDGAPVQRYDTHGAVVFLAGDRAIKVKRAVRFPFLDYSTLEKRKAACRAELDVNRKFAPQLYRGLTAITRQAGGALALGGDGEPVEWAVEMKRFDESRTLDHLAARGELDDALADRIAITIAAMHARAERVEPQPWIDALEGFVHNNTGIFRQHADLFPEADVAKLENQSLAALTRLRPLLVERGAQGLIRRGHGDLHLGNIVVLDGEPVAFDALEFDAVIASGDLLYDLAFLLMDLVEGGFDRAANRVINGYFAATNRAANYDGLAALPFFMSLRAGIRAMTTASRLDLGKPKVTQSARAYFALALRLLESAKPLVICTGGLSGTGKSMLARALAPLCAPSPGALIIRSDVERKIRFGVAEHDRLPAEAYRPEISAEIYRLTIDKAACIARAGYSVILDAVFARPDERAAAEAMAAETGAAFCGLFLTADLNTRLRRIGMRGADASDADAAVARGQEDFDLGAVNWEKIDAAGTPDDTLARANAAAARASAGP